MFMDHDQKTQLDNKKPWIDVQWVIVLLLWLIVAKLYGWNPWGWNLWN
jgi:hypothetical protein